MTAVKRGVIKGIKGAIFDLDGTLLDSMDVWREIDVEFLPKRGIKVPDDFMSDISGKSFKETADYVIMRFNLADTPQNLMNEWRDMAIQKYSNTVKLLPYAREYLLELKQSGVKLGVATSLTKELYEACLKANGVFDLFDVLCSVDEVARGKEYPDIYFHVINRLNLQPADCMIFEDVLPAIKSAKTTGAKVFAISEKYSLNNKQAIINHADAYLYSMQSAPIVQ